MMMVMVSFNYAIYWVKAAIITIFIIILIMVNIMNATIAITNVINQLDDIKALLHFCAPKTQKYTKSTSYQE